MGIQSTQAITRELAEERFLSIVGQASESDLVYACRVFGTGSYGSRAELIFNCVEAVREVDDEALETVLREPPFWAAFLVSSFLAHFASLKVHIVDVFFLAQTFPSICFKNFNYIRTMLRNIRFVFPP